MAARVIRPDWRKEVAMRVRKHEVRKGLAYAGQYAMGERETGAAAWKDMQGSRGRVRRKAAGFAQVGFDSPGPAELARKRVSSPASPPLSPLLILCGFFFLLAAALFLLPLRKGLEPWMASVGFASSAIGIGWSTRELVKWKP